MNLRENTGTFRHPQFFYGWVIVGIIPLNMMVIYGIRHSFSVFFPSILDEFGWSRGGTATMLSLNILVYGLLAPLAGNLADLWKPRTVMRLGVMILALATAGCAVASELWHFYLLFGILVPLGTTMTGWPLMAPALSNWFVKRRGLVLGIGSIGGGLSFAYAMFAEFLISLLAWRYAYVALAAVMLLVWLPFSLVFRYRPEDKGLRAYGSTDQRDSHKVAAGSDVVGDAATHEWTLKRALGDYRLWFLLLSNFLYWGVGSYLVLAHQVKFAGDVGYSSAFATSVFALFGVCMVAGQLSGSISDWIGREAAMTIASLLAMGGLAALLMVNDTTRPWLLYIYAVCLGLGNGLNVPTVIAGTADIFYGRHFGAIAGSLLAAMGVGAAIGPWLGGYVHDITGSYTIAFGIAMACFGLACVTFWIAAPRNAGKMAAR